MIILTRELTLTEEHQMYTDALQMDTIFDRMISDLRFYFHPCNVLINSQSINRSRYICYMFDLSLSIGQTITIQVEVADRWNG
jgi:hypothetical protein